MVDAKLLNFSLEHIMIMTVILLRTGALIFLMPVMGSLAVPSQVKALVTVVTALALLPVVPVTGSDLPTTIPGFLIFTVSELGLGAVLAVFSRLIFAAVETAGQMVGIQMGMGVAGVMDPQFGTQVSVIGQFWSIITVLLFLAVNGHHIFFSTLAESFQWVRPGGLHISNASYQGIIQGVAHMFILAIKIMAPVSAVLIFTQVALGILAKTVPQINLLIVSMPVTIGVGFIFVGLSLDLFIYLLEKNIDMLGRLLPKLAAGLGG